GPRQSSFLLVRGTFRLSDHPSDTSLHESARLGRGTVTPEERAHALAGIAVTGDLSRVPGAGLVIEAAVGDEQAKTALFKQLDTVVTNPGAVPAGDASSIPIARLTPATGRPEAVIGLYFFNPVPVMPLVEVVPLLHASLRVRAFTARDAADVTRSPTEPKYVIVDRDDLQLRKSCQSRECAQPSTAEPGLALIL
ncbi:3-hydroxyacyl-CoA dehydrogenase NAD-binding domain-containing protein, partial [Streptomyces sp. NPDC005283]|uniref:3-hydroxyacyl-CoA dehydrogenase NAD-binding domain-containing protein n=1 Tax=Streptomyces sp. NPDC005283 TaxID=3156871 RepID=UPI0034538AFE